MSGKLYGIGVGPGDPELLTLKAARVLQKSDILILPNKKAEDCYAYKIAIQAVPELMEKEIVCMDFPMTKNIELLNNAQRDCFEKTIELLQKNKIVSFLTIGDPCVYSTYQYLHRQILDDGTYEAEIISGIPSFCAVAAKLGISLGDKNEEIHVIPASYDLKDSLTLKGTKIYMKSGKKFKDLMEFFKTNNLFDTHNVYCVENCGLPNEMIYKANESDGSSLKFMKSLENVTGYLTTVILKEISE